MEIEKAKERARVAAVNAAIKIVANMGRDITLGLGDWVDLCNVHPSTVKDCRC
jgi:hypothetical protein